MSSTLCVYKGPCQWFAGQREAQMIIWFYVTSAMLLEAWLAEQEWCQTQTVAQTVYRMVLR